MGTQPLAEYFLTLRKRKPLDQSQEECFSADSSRGPVLSRSINGAREPCSRGSGPGRGALAARLLAKQYSNSDPGGFSLAADTNDGGIADSIQICKDLRDALSESERRQFETTNQIRRLESDALADEQELTDRIDAERTELSVLRERLRSSVDRDAWSNRVRAEMREVESERDAMQRVSHALQSEVMQARAEIRSEAAALHDPLAEASTEAIELSLHAESRALRSALVFCERQHEDNMKVHAEAEEAILKKSEENACERAELEESAERLRFRQARVADVLALDGGKVVPPVPGEDHDRNERADNENLREIYRHTKQELEKMHLDCTQLLRLNGAAEARVEELEKKLLNNGLRAKVKGAIVALKMHDDEAKKAGEETLKGAARLVYVMASVCGIPRMVFLALDSNGSGRISMCEFDCGLRLRFGMDYEAIVATERPVLRAIFKEFDVRKRGYLTEEDFARLHPEIWARYARKNWPRYPN